MKASAILTDVNWYTHFAHGGTRRGLPLACPIKPGGREISGGAADVLTLASRLDAARRRRPRCR